MQRVKMQDFAKEVHMSPNSIRYYIDTGQLDIGIKLIGPSGKPRYLLLQEKIDLCRHNGTLKKVQEAYRQT